MELIWDFPALSHHAARKSQIDEFIYNINKLFVIF